MRYRGMSRLTGLFVVLLLAFAPSVSAQLTKLRAAYSAVSSWSLATWLAHDGGL